MGVAKQLAARRSDADDEDEMHSIAIEASHSASSVAAANPLTSPLSLLFGEEHTQREMSHQATWRREPA